MKKNHIPLLLAASVVLLALVLVAACVQNSASASPSARGAPETITITDTFGRVVAAPLEPESVVCSGSGCLRYLVYLQGQDLVVGVDSIEQKD
jgi:iron complex transport system substrate-binding protein